MGFSDFREAFTSDTPMDWSVEPNEGSLKQKEDTHFIVKFKDTWLLRQKTLRKRGRCREAHEVGL